MTDKPSRSSSRLDTVLAYVVMGLVVISVVAFFAALIGGLNGMKEGDFARGFWPIVTATPWFALPLGFLLLIVLLVINGGRRRRQSRSVR